MNAADECARMFDHVAAVLSCRDKHREVAAMAVFIEVGLVASGASGQCLETLGSLRHGPRGRLPVGGARLLSCGSWTPLSHASLGSCPPRGHFCWRNAHNHLQAMQPLGQLSTFNRFAKARG